MRRIVVPGLALWLSSCYIEPVAVGVWDIETEAGGSTESAVWYITDPPALTIEGSGTTEAEEVDFAGSRLSWSSTVSYAGDVPADARVNFRGTIDGNRLIGTLFTQFGNYSVSGTRRRDEN